MTHITNDFSEDAMVPLPAPIPAGIVASAKNACVISGDVATGKTQQLLEAVQALLVAGIAPERIAVFCATPIAVRSFQTRLANSDARGHAVSVMTPRQCAQELLGVEEIAQATGRGNRLLAPFEMDFLMEDLKTSGVRPGRLKEMLRFFYKSLTELCDWEEEAWLLTGEENMVWDVLQECMHVYGVILEPEIANTVARYFHEHAAAKDAYGIDYIFVDDYQLLNRASQVLVNELAKESITIAGNPTLCMEVFDSYPYAAGFEEFKEANPTASIIALHESYACEQAQCYHDGLARSGIVPTTDVTSMHEKQACPELELFETPAEECQAVADKVKEALASGISAADIVVATPHAMWDINIANALKRDGIAVQTINSGAFLRGDLRDFGKSEAMRILTALFLVANPASDLAWRVWCGFGDHFANSSAIGAIRQWASNEEMTFSQALCAYYEAVDSIDQNVAEHAHVQAAVESGLAIITAAQEKRGDDLLVFIAQQIVGDSAGDVAELLSLVKPIEKCEHEAVARDACSMALCAQLRMSYPGLDTTDSVKLIPLNQLTGLTMESLLICGFVNGFMPKRGVLDREILTQEDADKQMANDVSVLIHAVSKPKISLAITGFKELPLEHAERLRLRIHRIQLKEGVRMALVEPSLYMTFCAQ